MLYGVSKQLLLQSVIQFLYRAVNVNLQFTLEQATRAQRGSRGITLLFLKLGATRRRGEWSAPNPVPFTPWNYPVRIV